MKATKKHFKSDKEKELSSFILRMLLDEGTRAQKLRKEFKVLNNKSNRGNYKHILRVYDNIYGEPKYYESELDKILAKKAIEDFASSTVKNTTKIVFTESGDRSFDKKDKTKLLKFLENAFAKSKSLNIQFDLKSENIVYRNFTLKTKSSVKTFCNILYNNFETVNLNIVK